MIQQVSSGSEMELQAKASEAMNNVMALYEQFGPPVLPSVEVCGDMLEFKCDDGWGHSLWMDWDVREGLLRARLNNGEELVEWCVGEVTAFQAVKDSLGADFFGRFRSGLGTGCIGMRFVHNSLLNCDIRKNQPNLPGGKARLEHGAIYTI